MNENKKNEILALVWLAVSVLALLSLLTYTPNDIPFEVSVTNSPAQNFFGISGAYIAWAFFLFFGKTAYFLVPLFLFWALAKWAGKKGQHLWLKIFSSAVFLLSACSLFSLVAAAPPIRRFQAGGILGYFASAFLTGLFGRGGVFVALVLFILSIALATELLVLQITANLFQRSKKMISPQVQKKPAEKIKETPLLRAKLTEFKQSLVEKVKSEPPKKPEIKISKPAAVREEKPPVKIMEPEAVAGSYQLPPIDLLQDAPAVDSGEQKADLENTSRVLEDTLRDFGIEAKVAFVEQGPTITRYELQPAAGVKVQKITSLENDIALALQATSVRILAPIPGKSRVGIEVPNRNAATVSLKEILQTQEFRQETSKVAIAIGKETGGAPIVCNLAEMPHLLIAGATNTGKSVCINSILSGVLFRSTPEEVKFLIVDPKMVELHFYNDLPHLICPVVTDKSKVPGVLAWLLAEMERRYRILSKVGAKNLLGFNEKVENKEITPQLVRGNMNEDNEDEAVIVKKMPYILLVIDELADLMLASAQEVETSITRLAQLARAVGIHMILATQRPSVDVITGVIKANFPARIAFQVASKVDSRTILDENGADKLLGRGDLLLMDPRKSKLIRAQGAYIQDKEIERVVDFIKKQKYPAQYEAVAAAGERKLSMGEFKRDEVYEEAKKMVLETGQASVSMVQRRLGVGYTRAARLIDMMEEDGIVGPYRGAKPREILVPTAQQARAAKESAGEESS